MREREEREREKKREKERNGERGADRPLVADQVAAGGDPGYQQSNREKRG